MSASLTYVHVVILQLHLHMVYIYFAADFVCKSLFDIWSVFSSRLLTHKLMSQGFQQFRLQAAFRKFHGRYNDLICPYNLLLGHMLSDMFHLKLIRYQFWIPIVNFSWKTDLDYGLSCLPNLEMGLTADVTDQQGCLLLHGTWSHLYYIQRSLYAHYLNCISYRTYEINYCSFLSFL
jgi:hypothetical protein